MRGPHGYAAHDGRAQQRHVQTLEQHPSERRRRPCEAVTTASTESASGGVVVRQLEVDDVTSRRRGRTGAPTIREVARWPARIA